MLSPQVKCEADLTPAAWAAAPTCKGRILPTACFTPAMQINLELTKKWDLTSALHHLPVVELLVFLSSFSLC